MGMIKKGGYGIEIMMKDCFGKRPGLYVYDEKKNEYWKVGNFASEEKARTFERYLMYLCALSDAPKEV